MGQASKLRRKRSVEMFDKTIDPMLQTERIRIASVDPNMTSRGLLRQRLTWNIKKYSRLIRNIGGVTIACINQDFINEIISLFIETLSEILMEREKINFDQFGTFEIITTKNKVINTVYTGFKDYIIPEAKVIRFHPFENFKNRIKGVDRGYKVKHYNSDKTEIIYSDYELMQMAKERGINLETLLESCKDVMVKGAIDMDREEVEYLHSEEGMSKYHERVIQEEQEEEERCVKYSAEDEEEMAAEEEREYKEYFIESENKNADKKR